MLIETDKPTSLRRTYLSRIEDVFKKDYGPHTIQYIIDKTGFTMDIVRTSLHAFKRYGVVVLLKSKSNANLWLYNPRGDTRKMIRIYRAKEESRAPRRPKVIEGESDTIESGIVRQEPGDRSGEANLG